MHKLKQRGFAHILLLLLLLAGLGVGLYLVQNKTHLFSKAAPVIPQHPETSFELEVQAGTAEPFIEDPVKLTGVGVGAKFRVDIWARSDIDPANLFAAKIKFPTDLLQVVEVNKRGANSFVNQWVDSSFDNSKGEISLVGGVNPPGLLTSAQGSGNVKGVSTVDTSGPGTTCNDYITYTGNENRYAVWNGQCGGALQAPGSGGIGQGCCEQACGATPECDEQFPSRFCDSNCQFRASGGNSPGDSSGQATACNGNVAFQGNENRYAYWNGQCSGSRQADGSGGIGQGCCEKACGASPECDELAPGEGRCNTNCQYAASIPVPSVTPSATPVPAQPTPIPTAAPVNTPTTKPSPTSSPPPVLGPARLMASVIFTAKNAGTANIDFTDGSQILRNSDGLNIISAKKGLLLPITTSTPPPISAPIPPLTPTPTPTSVSNSTPTPIPTAESCVIDTVDWGGLKDVPQGQTIPLRVYTRRMVNQSTCSGKSIHFEVHRNGILLDDILANVQLPDTKLSAPVFNEGRWVAFISTNWTAEYNPLIPFTNAEYYFNANIVGDPNIMRSELLSISPSGGSSPTPTLIVAPTPSSVATDYQCTAITSPDAQLGQLPSGESVFYITGDKNLITLLPQVSPPGGIVNAWDTKYKNIATGIGSPSLDFAGVVGGVTVTAPPVGRYLSTYSVTVSVDVQAPDGVTHVRKNCPDIQIVLEPVQQVATSTQSVQSTEVKNLRHDGDVNSDGKVNLTDMSKVLSQVGQKGQSEADLNGDGTVNTLDVLKERQILKDKGAL